mmetsp:Transcript_51803/g.127160  ORF Transcript_51803/g.127160 Transcript_51803/m.127160 type:complete len:367 (+) Transcript_51803:82-1182(+)
MLHAVAARVARGGGGGGCWRRWWGTAAAAGGTHDAVADARNDAVKVYVSGEYYARHEAKISVFDSGYLVGDGVWEGVRVVRGKYVFLEQHLDRLYGNASATAFYSLEQHYPRHRLVDILYDVLAVNGMHGESDIHVRLMATRGTKKTPSQDPRLVVGGPNLVIIAERKKANPATTQRGVRLHTAAVRRPPSDTLDARWNCHSKLHEVVALSQALHAGADEALMLDTSGNVATCNATNFFCVRRRRHALPLPSKLPSPDDDRDGHVALLAKHFELLTSERHSCMNGITRGMVLTTARNAGLFVNERPFSLTDVYSAAEAFVTGSFGGITPVRAVDGRRLVGDDATSAMGVYTSFLRRLYYEAVDADV